MDYRRQVFLLLLRAFLNEFQKGGHISGFTVRCCSEKNVICGEIKDSGQSDQSLDGHASDTEFYVGAEFRGDFQLLGKLFPCVT